MKKDRNGVLVLIVLIILVISSHFIISKIEVTPHSDFTELIKQVEAWENELKLQNQSLRFFYFNPNTVTHEQFDSFPIPKFIKNNIIRYRSAGGRFFQPADLRKIYGMNDSIYALIEPWVLFPEHKTTEAEKKTVAEIRPKNLKIDPNTCTPEELLRLGFNSFQVSNIESYREKGGKFLKVEDLKKIYGIDSILFSTVMENIYIGETQSFVKNVFAPDNQKVELNTADSLTLIKLKGIGPVFASRIIKYRNLLGGFISSSQLLEVYGFPEETFYELKEEFVVDTTAIKKIRINFAEYSDLIRHPYIEKQHVDAVLNYRNTNGPILSNEQLLKEGLIDSASFWSMKPYITYR